jgi:hypothetical protein
MDRDALFALNVVHDAKQIGYLTIIVDGSCSIENNLDSVEKILKFK